jgi:hypothetical protein
MAQLDRYQVVKKNGEWKIEHGGRHSPAFDSQAAAIKQAKVKAKQAQKRHGKTTQVLVQGRNMSWRTEYTYGHDPRSRPS